MFGCTGAVDREGYITNEQAHEGGRDYLSLWSACRAMHDAFDCLPYVFQINVKERRIVYRISTCEALRPFCPSSVLSRTSAEDIKAARRFHQAMTSILVFVVFQNVADCTPHVNGRWKKVSRRRCTCTTAVQIYMYLYVFTIRLLLLAVGD